MASQDLMGQAWPFRDPTAAEAARRRERGLWCHLPADAASDQRLPPRSSRLGDCHMPRRVFLALAFGWSGVLTALLGIVLAIRWHG